MKNLTEFKPLEEKKRETGYLKNDLREY
ncbi:hypothetical protein CCACVL1_08329 [Corchorus capsularis]|uniref:Uncharacterized protein n=1 Tax=Corchorus capsularis TaxID=210143 RepID=A0A1R3J108_COCAP|nr:hypothetical protein CCACVL1_08329 [Corchorus capsularis]